MQVPTGMQLPVMMVNRNLLPDGFDGFQAMHDEGELGAAQPDMTAEMQPDAEATSEPQPDAEASVEPQPDAEVTSDPQADAEVSVEPQPDAAPTLEEISAGLQEAQQQRDEATAETAQLRIQLDDMKRSHMELVQESAGLQEAQQQRDETTAETAQLRIQLDDMRRSHMELVQEAATVSHGTWLTRNDGHCVTEGRRVADEGRQIADSEENTSFQVRCCLTTYKWSDFVITMLQVCGEDR